MNGMPSPLDSGGEYYHDRFFICAVRLVLDVFITFPAQKLI